MSENQEKLKPVLIALLMWFITKSLELFLPHEDFDNPLNE